ncbi:MAG: glycosyltransferase family 2 protein [Paramuribaculum sp.]|nr:glycosyltransferase family 2 protein [Paramuribaculum sp.]
MLDVAIATHTPAGIERVAAQNLPQMRGVRYIVSWQRHENEAIPEGLSERDDIEIHRFDGIGQSSNRNNALCHCTGDIILIADDDVVYTSEGLKALIDVFEADMDVDLVTFIGNPQPGRVFPDRPVELKRRLPRNYHVCAIEIAIRHRVAKNMAFCMELGLGSPRFHGGEDEMFLQSAIRRGLICRFYPVKVCNHPGESTGTKSRLTDANLRAAGCVIALTYPLSALLRLPMKAWRVSAKRQSGFFRALLHLAAGMIAAPGVLRRNRSILW